MTHDLTGRGRQLNGHEVDSNPSASTQAASYKRYRSPPSGTRRERALSISPSNNDFEKEVSDQSESIFFKLPLELREMIYTELFSSYERVWIVFAEERLACIGETGKDEDTTRYVNPRREYENAPEGLTSAKLDSSRVTTATNPLPALPYKPPPRRRESQTPVLLGGLDAMPFLLTCRALYTEALPYLYSTQTFSFADPLPFLAFAASLPPSHLKHLRAIILTPSARFLDIIPARIKHGICMYSSGSMLSHPGKLALDYSFFHAGLFAGTLYNAGILPPRDESKPVPPLMWDAIANALGEMRRLMKVHIMMLNVPRHIGVSDEPRHEHSWTRNARDFMDSLEWVGRDRPREGVGVGEERRAERKEAEVIFENIWWSRSRAQKGRGHWVREVKYDGKVEWREVGEAAEPVIRTS